MELDEELARIGAVAAGFAAEGEEVSGVVPTEPRAGARVYVCSFEQGEARTWLAFDAAAQPLADRALVREAVSIAAMCEIAEDSAGGGHLDELRAQLVALRITEAPEGIEEAEDAALALERTIRPAPRVASPHYLDDLGAATRRLELALGDPGPSPFAELMKQAVGPIDELMREVEGGYKATLE